MSAATIQTMDAQWKNTKFVKPGAQRKATTMQKDELTALAPNIVVGWCSLWMAQRLEAQRRFGVDQGRWVVSAPLTERSTIIGPYFAEQVQQ